jgi:hypothetical protein
VGTATYMARPFVLGFVYAYLDTATVPGQPSQTQKELSDFTKTTWVKIKKGAPPEDMKIRLDIQKDSLLTKTYLDGTVRRIPPAYNSKLDFAREKVGGCWYNIKKVGE